jgi:hypothetical protein
VQNGGDKQRLADLANDIQFFVSQRETLEHDIILKSGCISYLLHLFEPEFGEHSPLQYLVMFILANFCGSTDDVCKEVCSHGGLKIMLKYFVDPAAGRLREEAVRALANVSNCGELRDELLALNILETLNQIVLTEATFSVSFLEEFTRLISNICYVAPAPAYVKVSPRPLPRWSML